MEWEITFGLPGYYERVVAVSQSGDGGYTMVGGKGLGVDWRSNTRGPSSTYVLKIDSLGKKTWEKEVAWDCSTLENALQTEDGGFVIGILPGSNGNNTEQLSRNITIIKVNPAGDKVWEKTFGGEKDDYMTSMERTGDGGCLIAGSSNSFSDGGDYDAYLIKINGSGDKIWEKTFGNNFWSTDARHSSDGGCVIVGAEEGYIRVIKTDPDGNQVWAKDLSELHPYYVKPTDAGSMIIVGRTAGPDKWGDVYAAKIGWTDPAGMRPILSPLKSI